MLVSGALRVRKGDIQVSTITNPGALVGEMSVLQGTEHGATVEATERSVLRHAADGHSLLDDPAITKIVAIGLAERLAFATTISPTSLGSTPMCPASRWSRMCSVASGITAGRRRALVRHAILTRSTD